MLKAKLLFMLLTLLVSSNLKATAPIMPPPEFFKCEVKNIEVEDITPELIALSEFIMEGTIISPIQQIQSYLSSKEHKYFVSSLVHAKSLKGNIKGGRILIRHFAREQKSDVCIKSLIKFDRKNVIVFLVKPDEFDEEHFYFAGHTHSAFVVSTSKKVSHIKNILSQQSNALKDFEHKDFSALIDKDVHQKVKALINKSLKPAFQQSSFDELVKLGKPAIPSLILLIDDYRKLPNSHTMSPNYLHYGPVVVVDELSTILSFLTDKHLGRINNGGSQREREHAIAAWRLFLTDFK